MNAEIVSADSRQVFRLMDIGTAKPTPTEMAKAPHHLIDIKNPDELFNAGMYSILGRQVIDEILNREHCPIIVGGSGLYIRALVDGVFAGPYRDLKIRKRLNLQAEEKGLDTLYKQLQYVDPEAAHTIHVNDRKRIVRALEVYTLSGHPISRIQKENTHPADFRTEYWGLRWPREHLYHRISERVDKMIHAGLIEEVLHLREMGYGPDLNSLDSVGYKEVFSHLDGQINKVELMDLIKRNTRRYAKKQLTWFRRNSNINWINLAPPVEWEKIVTHIIHKTQCCTGSK